LNQHELTQKLTHALGFDLNDEEVDSVAEGIVAWRAKMRPTFPELVQISMEDAIRRAGCAPYSKGTSCDDFSVNGLVAAGYEGVKDAFADNFRKGLERDAHLCLPAR
jgi:hypothetical protein